MSRPRWIIGLTASAYIMVVLDQLVVITALPQMRRDLHVGLSTLQWTVNAYGIAFAAGIVVAAALGDRLGRRRVFVLGLALFTVASAVCALAPDASGLIAARAVQGLGGAAVLPLSLTILMEAFPPGRHGRIVGIYTALAGIAVAAGPLIGGAVTEGLDWHWIFWINLPIGVAAGVLSLRLLPESFGPRERLDLLGVALLAGGVLALVWGLVRADAVGWGSAESVGALVVGSALIAGFFGWEARARQPMLPLRLLRVRGFAAGNVTTLFMAASFATAFLVVQYFQLGLGYSPLEAGVRLLPWFLTPLFVSPVAGVLSDRVGRRPLIVAGLFLQSVGIAWVALAASAGANYPELAAALFVAGVGISMALPAVQTAVIDAVGSEEMGKASGINNTLNRFGLVFGIAVATSVFNAFGHLGSPAAVTDGFRPALAVCAGLSLLGAITALAIAPRGSDDPRAVARAYHDAWTSKDFDQAAALLSPAIRVEVPINDYPTKAAFARALASFGSLVERVELLSELAAGSEAMQLYDLEVVGLGTMRIVEHFTVSDGQITRLRQVHDTAAIRATAT